MTNMLKIPTPQRVAAGVPVEVLVGVVTKSHLWPRDETQQGLCFLVQCSVRYLLGEKSCNIYILLGVEGGCGVEVFVPQLPLRSHPYRCIQISMQT